MLSCHFFNRSNVSYKSQSLISFYFEHSINLNIPVLAAVKIETHYFFINSDYTKNICQPSKIISPFLELF